MRRRRGSCDPRELLQLCLIARLSCAEALKLLELGLSRQEVMAHLLSATEPATPKPMGAGEQFNAGILITEVVQ